MNEALHDGGGGDVPQFTQHPIDTEVVEEGDTRFPLGRALHLECDLRLPVGAREVGGLVAEPANADPALAAAELSRDPLPELIPGRL